MRKILVVIMGVMMLLMACNRETPVIPPLPPDSAAPTLDFEFVSIASTTKFAPFGDTMPNAVINRGYEVQLSDTNENILAACSGIVTSIVPDTAAAGGNLITMKFKKNSIYYMVYGGVTNVEVNVNDSLPGGSILGKISGSGIIDFQLIMNNNEAVCPLNYGSAGFNQAIQQAISFNNSNHPGNIVSNACITQSLLF